MSDYKPSPQNLEKIMIPEQLLACGETLAKDIHEAWALERMTEGWTYGERYDHDQKKHPGLVPYELLSENEKNYDRMTSMHTIRLLLSMGFTISKE